MLRHHISSPRRLPASSEKIFRDLEELNRLSEAEFLSIGERLQGLSQRAREIASQCGEAAGCISGPEFDGAIEKLRRTPGR